MADYVWKALLTEFLGTFTLVFVGAGAVALTAAQGGSLIGSAFAFGLVLMSLFYAWGSFSGAHFNPAVSFGFALSGRMHWGLMLGYWIAQLVGGIAAGALIAYLFGTDNGAGASIGSFTNTDAWKAVLLEAILTFFLVITILLVTRNPMLAIASGAAIGLVLTFDMLVGFPLTGASMNPARSLGPAIFSNNMGTYWIYVVGPLVGALLAALVYRLFTTDFSCCDKLDECGNVMRDECGRPLKECRRPIYDNCGNHVTDCNGKQYETYTKHERKLTHMQETPMLYLGEWMSSHGFDPRYIKQELDKATEKVMPGGVVSDPKAVVQNAVQAGTPVAQSVAAQMTSPMQTTITPMSSAAATVQQSAPRTPARTPRTVAGSAIVGPAQNLMSGPPSSAGSAMGSTMSSMASAPSAVTAQSSNFARSVISSLPTLSSPML